MSEIRKAQLVGLLIVLTFVFLVAEGIFGPPAHDVHSFGASAVTPAVYTFPFDTGYWQFGPASESLADIKCFIPLKPQSTCAAVFPSLKQTPHTLYYAWAGCIPYLGVNFNLEWFGDRRTLVGHCYESEGWLYVQPGGNGVRLRGSLALLAIPTSQIGPGTIHIDEDDRIEHLIGDQSSEYGLTSATVT